MCHAVKPRRFIPAADAARLTESVTAQRLLIINKTKTLTEKDHMSFAGGSQEVELRLISSTTGSGPVSCGIPWPRGALQELASLALRDSRDRRIPLQARALDRWPDGSVRWVLLDWHAETEAAPYRLGVADGAPLPPQNAVTVRSNGSAVTIETGAARFEFHIRRPISFPLRSGWRRFRRSTPHAPASPWRTKTAVGSFPISPPFRLRSRAPACCRPPSG